MTYLERTDFLQELLGRIEQVDAKAYQKLIENMPPIQYFIQDASEDFLKKNIFYMKYLQDHLLKYPERGSHDKILVKIFLSLINIIQKNMEEDPNFINKEKIEEIPKEDILKPLDEVGNIISKSISSSDYKEDKEDREDLGSNNKINNVNDKLSALMTKVKTKSKKSLDFISKKEIRKIPSKPLEDTIIQEKNTASSIMERMLNKESKVDNFINDIPDDAKYAKYVEEIEEIEEVEEVEEEKVKNNEIIQNSDFYANQKQKNIIEDTKIMVRGKLGEYKEVSSNYYNKLISKKQHQDDIDGIFNVVDKEIDLKINIDFEEVDNTIEDEFKFEEEVKEPIIDNEIVFDTIKEVDNTIEDIGFEDSGSLGFDEDEDIWEDEDEPDYDEMFSNTSQISSIEELDYAEEILNEDANPDILSAKEIKNVVAIELVEDNNNNETNIEDEINTEDEIDFGDSLDDDKIINFTELEQKEDLEIKNEIKFEEEFKESVVDNEKSIINKIKEKSDSKEICEPIPETTIKEEKELDFNEDIGLDFNNYDEEDHLEEDSKISLDINEVITEKSSEDYLFEDNEDLITGDEITNNIEDELNLFDEDLEDGDNTTSKETTILDEDKIYDEINFNDNEDENKDSISNEIKDSIPNEIKDLIDEDVELDFSNKELDEVDLIQDYKDIEPIKKEHDFLNDLTDETNKHFKESIHKSIDSKDEEKKDSKIINLNIEKENQELNKRVQALESQVKELYIIINEFKSLNNIIREKVSENIYYKIIDENIEIYIDNNLIKIISNIFTKLDNKLNVYSHKNIIKTRNNEVWYIGSKNGEIDKSKIKKYSDNTKLFKELLFEYVVRL